MHKGKVHAATPRSSSTLLSHLPRPKPKLIRIALVLVFVLWFVWSQCSHQPPLPQSVPSSEFPRKIWQTWKVGPLDLDPQEHLRARSWLEKNSNHRYEVLTDDNDINYVQARYGPLGFNRPDIVQMFAQIEAKIVRADLLRYLVMYAEGGTYADIDVEALRPISRFIPNHYLTEDIDMVIGVEIDQPEFSSHRYLGQKCKSFCQWTFMTKPGAPIMLKLVERIMKWLDETAKRQGVSVSKVKLDFDDVITGTGPSAFTEAILDDMSAKLGRKITWEENFHDMAESKLLAGYLVLTVEAFAAGQGHSDSGNHDARTALVKHHYHASGWPSSHPRFTHPIYGEVERCNWNAKCVSDWDENTAKFDALPPAQKVIEVAIKKSHDQEAMA